MNGSERIVIEAQGTYRPWSTVVDDGVNGTFRFSVTFRFPRTLDTTEINKLSDFISQENFYEAEIILKEFLQEKQSIQDFNGQAEAFEALGNLYTLMSKFNLASEQLNNAKVLYQELGNYQGVSEVEAQFQEIESIKMQIEQRYREIQQNSNSELE